VQHFNHFCKSDAFLSFPFLFVPSLSWQNGRFPSVNEAQKPGVFRTEGGELAAACADQITIALVESDLCLSRACLGSG
jgi:hypothetical protein